MQRGLTRESCVRTQDGTAGSYGKSLFNCLMNCPFPRRLCRFPFTPAVGDVSDFCTSLPTLVCLFVCLFLIFICLFLASSGLSCG